MNRLLIPLLLMLLVSACGKTGALYLPKAEQAEAVEKTPVEKSPLNIEETNRGSF